MSKDDIWDWLETELHYAHANFEEAESRMTEIEFAMERYSKKKSLPRELREEYNEYKKEREE